MTAKITTVMEIQIEPILPAMVKAAEPAKPALEEVVQELRQTIQLAE